MTILVQTFTSSEACSLLRFSLQMENVRTFGTWWVLTLSALSQLYKMIFLILSITFCDVFIAHHIDDYNLSTITISKFKGALPVSTFKTTWTRSPSSAQKNANLNIYTSIRTQQTASTKEDVKLVQNGSDKSFLIHLT